MAVYKMKTIRKELTRTQKTEEAMRRRKPFDGLIVRYDTGEITLTPRYVEALNELMEANLQMMRDDTPKEASWWVWGICEIIDFSHPRGLEMRFGGEESRPDILLEKVNTLVVNTPFE